MLLQQDGRAEAGAGPARRAARRKPPEVRRSSCARACCKASVEARKPCRFCRRAFAQNPDDKRLRLTYARLLVEQDRLDDAKGEFAKLVQEYPNDDDLRFSLALVCLEAEAWEEAIVYLGRADRAPQPCRCRALQPRPRLRGAG